MKKLSIILFQLLLIFSIQAQSKKTDNLLNNFLKAYPWDYKVGVYPVMKWDKDTLYYYEYGSQASFSENAWNLILQEVSHLSGISLNKADSPLDANIVMYFGPVVDYHLLIKDRSMPKNLAQNYSNWSNRNWDKDFSLRSSGFCVDENKTSSSAEARYQMIKGLLKCFGMLGSLESENSIFHEGFTGSNYSFGRNDKRLFKMMYYHKVKPGMKNTELKKCFDIGYLEALSKEKL